MSRIVVMVSALLALFLGGCASSPVVGTWAGRGSAGSAPFSFGSVSFVGDNTFTAEARYGGNVRVQSGTWSTEGDRLMLSTGGNKREYTYTVASNELTVTEPKSGQSITLDRLKK